MSSDKITVKQLWTKLSECLSLGHPKGLYTYDMTVQLMAVEKILNESVDMLSENKLTQDDKENFNRLNVAVNAFKDHLNICLRGGCFTYSTIKDVVILFEQFIRDVNEQTKVETIVTDGARN